MEQLDKEFLSIFALKREIECLTVLTDTLIYMSNGHIPELPETKKAAQTAIKEICATLCEFVDKI